jgi:hypothetical protein
MTTVHTRLVDNGAADAQLLDLEVNVQAPRGSAESVKPDLSRLPLLNDLAKRLVTEYLK